VQFDTILRNGWIVDGSGAPGRKADIGIIGDAIAAIGDLHDAEANSSIDVSGKVVCPGFIDVHVHSELALLEGIDRYAPLKMGVTTQLASPDGFSWAPLQAGAMKEMREYMKVFYEDSRLAPDRDLSIADLLAIFRGNLPSNLVLQVPHGSVRLAVMGWDTRTANEEEMIRMEKIVRDWMEHGAKAFATGLDYEPMRRADLNELVRLSIVTREHGGIYVAHQRGYADKVEIGCKETFAIAREANIPAHISHFTVDHNAARLVDEAVAEGLEVTFDMYPYPAGCTHMLLSFPDYAQAGSPEEMLENLRSNVFRARITDDLEKLLPRELLRFASVATPEPSGWEGKTLGEVQRELGLSLTDTVCEVLLQTRLQALMIHHWPLERHQFLEATFKHPLHMVGTDGIYIGKKPHPRGFGTYPKILREYVYEKQWLTLEEAIYKMCGFPAARFNIERRGLLSRDYYADLVVFDPNKVNARATFEEPRQEPEGILHVMVNGEFVIRETTVQPGNPGRIL
jgi:N-acyl-D-amino-acid deacylase